MRCTLWFQAGDVSEDTSDSAHSPNAAGNTVITVILQTKILTNILVQRPKAVTSEVLAVIDFSREFQAVRVAQQYAHFSEVGSGKRHIYE